MNRPEVFKFGGVAVGSAAAIRTAVGHVQRAAPSVAVVVSAMNGVTDLLLDAGHAALRHDAARCEAAAAEFETRHLGVIRELLRDRARRSALKEQIAGWGREIRSMTESIGVLEELTTRAQDTLVARGERAAAAMVAAALNEAGIEAELVDALDVVHTERRAGTLWPDFAKCDRAAKKHVLPLLRVGRVAVMPGFLAAGPDGSLVTLGRGGTDFSAAILARGIGARSLTLFKEVDGLMTADPKSVPDARVLAELHYREAAELAYYGAKVLHPRTMIPLVERRIPLHVRNTFNDSAGTRIAADVKPGAYPVKALTAIHRQALIAIEGNGMIGVPGVAGRAFTALSQAGHSVSMISQASSEASICFVVPEGEAKHAVAALEQAFQPERVLKLIDRIDARSGVALIAVVGLGMRGTAGIAARTFSAISAADVNIVAIAQGSSELNITVAVAEGDATRALVALHAEYQLHKIRPLADPTGREAKLTLLGFGQIGRELARQLVAHDAQLRRDHGVDLKVIAVADRSGIRIDDHGFSPAALQRFAKQKASGARLFDHGSHLTLGELQKTMQKELWVLPSHRPVLVDLTSEETGPLLQEALEHGFHIVCANKKPLAGPQIEFEMLTRTAKQRGLALRYEATAGAGLPVLDTIAKLHDSGDRIETILGCFSGTLGYLMTALEDGVPFSEAVRRAWQLGYTEPDPRDDLSGVDVARKALILARTLGYRREMEEIALQGLIPSPGPLGRGEGEALDPESFIAGLVSLDDDYRERVARARAEGKRLRYVAKITRRAISVGLEAVPESSPIAHLRGTDNQVAIYSRRYKTNPLVVTGPGAGAKVTAAGVLNDIVAIATMERRR
jgi:aspartokinase/homoserine dehydrogenase 1